MDRYLRQSLPTAAMGDWVDVAPDAGRGSGVDAHRVRLTGEALRSAQAGYYGLINHIDDQLYWLVHEFKARSREMGRPWVIVLTSDHGEMLADHAYFRKCEPYEGASHIPFLIQGSPELGFQKGAVCEQPVCLEDVMPTLLALAEVAIPEGVDGEDLLPVLRGRRDVERPWLHGEHAPCYSKVQAYHFLTDGQQKYIWRPLDGSEQLFDLAADPQERHDLAQDATYAEALHRWRARLIRRLQGRPEGFTDGERLIPGRNYPAVMDHAQP
jgi:arylsulfatase A-like enzyme